MEAPQAEFLKSRLEILIKYKENSGAAGENLEIPPQNTNKIQCKFRRRRRRFLQFHLKILIKYKGN